MIVHQIVNNFHSSNTFILELTNSKVVLIDVGNFDEIYHWLTIHNKQVHTVILTHEHSDHCHGMNELFELSPFNLYCSKMCSINIANCKQNFSLYIEDLETFEIALPTTTIKKDMDVIDICGQSFTFIETPGHSPGSMCIITGDKIFTGDTILNGIKTPLNLPHSDKEQYDQSIQKLSVNIKKGMIIYPGHDTPFEYMGIDRLLTNGCK